MYCSFNTLAAVNPVCLHGRGELSGDVVGVGAGFAEVVGKCVSVECCWRLGEVCVCVHVCVCGRGEMSTGGEQVRSVVRSVYLLALCESGDACASREL